MRSHRLSIGPMMAAIAVLAPDLALIRIALADRGPDLAAMDGEKVPAKILAASWSGGRP